MTFPLSLVLYKGVIQYLVSGYFCLPSRAIHLSWLNSRLSCTRYLATLTQESLADKNKLGVCGEG